ncbi:hypothetical protein E2562_024338 [Oryza meyeriana var. granulata]|uniref:Uncharacterized protein n=1 Tax=Oryza meyeriana var. granulata TaxID=110450 RepID=A0A6G1C903_9ORYZ|nr:hypothetical protein E2562_024338 [Oryza meyeriana var. granulata]
MSRSLAAATGKPLTAFPWHAAEGGRGDVVRGGGQGCGGAMGRPERQRFHGGGRAEASGEDARTTPEGGPGWAARLSAAR